MQTEKAGNRDRDRAYKRLEAGIRPLAIDVQPALQAPAQARVIAPVSRPVSKAEKLWQRWFS